MFPNLWQSDVRWNGCDWPAYAENRVHTQKTTLLGTSEQMDERRPALSRLRIQVFCHYRHPGHHHQPPSSSLLLFLIRAACSKLSPASLKQPAAAAETHVHTNHVSWPARPTNQYCAIEPLNLSSSVCLTWGPAMPARPSIHTTEEKLPTRRRYVGGHFKYTFSPKEIRFCLSMQSTRRGRQGWSVGRSVGRRRRPPCSVRLVYVRN